MRGGEWGEGKRRGVVRKGGPNNVYTYEWMYKQLPKKFLKRTPTTANAGKDAGKKEPSYAAGGNVS
jgi:hypothetical protein